MLGAPAGGEAEPRPVSFSGEPHPGCQGTLWVRGCTLPQSPKAAKPSWPCRGRRSALSPAPRGAGKDLAGPWGWALGPPQAPVSGGAWPCVSAETEETQGSGWGGKVLRRSQGLPDTQPRRDLSRPRGLAPEEGGGACPVGGLPQPLPSASCLSGRVSPGVPKHLPKRARNARKSKWGPHRMGSSWLPAWGCSPPSHRSCAPAKPPRPLASRDSCQLCPRVSPSGRWSPPHFAEGRQQTTLHPKNQLSNTPSKGSSHIQVPHGAPGCKPSVKAKSRDFPG